MASIPGGLPLPSTVPPPPSSSPPPQRGFIYTEHKPIGHPCLGVTHGRMNYKDTKPYMSAFLSVDLLTDFAAFCLTDFIDWRYIHSRFVFSTQLVNCCPHGRRNYTCVLLPLYCTFSLTSSPPFPMYSIL